MPYFTNVSNIKLYYDHIESPNHTSKPILVFLHGGGSSTDTFDKNFSAFLSHFDVYALDTRGHGRSFDQQDTLHNFDLYASDVLCFIKLINNDHTRKMYAVGFSDGANTIMTLLYKNTCTFEAVAVIGGNLTPQGMGDAALSMIRNADKQHMGSLIGKGPLATHKKLSPLGSNYAENGLFEKIRHLWLFHPNFNDNSFVNNTTRVLVMNGDRDMMVNVTHAYQVFAAFSPNSSFSVIPDAGHACYREKPFLVNAILLDFFLKNNNNYNKNNRSNI